MMVPTPFETEKVDFKIQKEILSNKNNNFIVFFDTESNKLNIKAIRDDYLKKTYINKFSVSKIKKK